MLLVEEEAVSALPIVSDTSLHELAELDGGGGGNAILISSMFSSFMSIPASAVLNNW